MLNQPLKNLTNAKNGRVTAFNIADQRVDLLGFMFKKLELILCFILGIYIVLSFSAAFLIVLILFMEFADLNHRETTLSQRQQSVSPTSPTLSAAGIADQNSSDGPLMSEREMTRLEKFKQLLAGPNTDLGKL